MRKTRYNSKRFVQCGIAELGFEPGNLLRSIMSFALREAAFAKADGTLRI